VQTATRPAEARSAARRSALTVLAVALALLVAAAALAVYLNRDDQKSSGTGPEVGADLHAVFTLENRTFVSGHSGAAYSDKPGAWTQIEDLDDKDGMGWARTTNALLVGGHGGLYRSTNGGRSFEPDPGVTEGTDIHGLGAAGQTVYLSTPGQGLYVSTDGGESFTQRGGMPALMGTVLVDPANPDQALAADMQSGAVRTTDGGRTWQPLGGPEGAMSVAQDPTDARVLVVVGMDAAATSRDGGASWAAFDVPAGTTAVTYTPSGILVAAVLNGERAQTYRLLSGTWTSVE